MDAFLQQFGGLNTSDDAGFDRLRETPHPVSFARWSEEEKNGEIPDRLPLNDQRVGLLVHVIEADWCVDLQYFTASRISGGKVTIDKIDKTMIQEVSWQEGLNSPLSIMIRKLTPTVHAGERVLRQRLQH